MSRRDFAKRQNAPFHVSISISRKCLPVPSARLHRARKWYYPHIRFLSDTESSPLTPTELESLRTECDTLVNHVYSERDLLADAGCIVEPLSCGYVDHDPIHPEAYKHDQTFYRKIRSQITEEKEILDVILHKIAAMAIQVLPVEPSRELYLDSEYMPLTCRHIPTVACWITLDDVSEANGTLHIEPYPQTSSFGSHTCLSSLYPSTPSANPVIVTVPAGSVVLMSGAVRHCSGGNDSGRFRRAFMPQYSAGIVWSDRVMRKRDDEVVGQMVKNAGELLAMAVSCGNL
ncbi:hypothetical protein BC937DRAFT_89747 [Endogone sp. FLAS-F59071]|nr:hypothetical protein BC937DRAFT_89747 [Endogone sp. FLAS-F59071]|eukprot:RUS17607.1 hypothetical protein BC937DRAFT_89747 [Endogone sp. FLAS-F59071]